MSAKNELSNPDQNTQSTLIEELRQLRRDARRLNSGLVKRLKPFQKEDRSFKTHPESKDRSKEKGAKDISVGSTCTVLMAAIGAGKAAIGTDEKDKLFDKATIKDLFKRVVVNAEWASSGLDDGNGFTTALLIRSVGLVVREKIMVPAEFADLKHDDFQKNLGVSGKTLKEIIEEKANTPEESFAVEGYPPKSTHAYWFVDGAISMGVDLEKSTWQKIATWASNEFYRQLIYVSAGNDGLMDPPSLAMAACLINLIRRFTEEKAELAAVSRSLPSGVELDFGIRQVFAVQSDSGIWHRYFPLFHFPKGHGAADYCYSFEFLEAIQIEFGTSVLRDLELLKRVKRTISWCDTHELVFTDSTGKIYRGWNAGGEVRNLEAGMVESWATASVHMFLMQLERKIDDLLDELILKRFDFDRRSVIESSKTFDNLVDAEVRFPLESATTLKYVIQKEVLENVRKSEVKELIESGLPVPRSALLFGPPGTSKSRLAESIAEYLGWPLVVITPSEFLGKGLEQVHAQVDDRFRDLMDLQRAVVFFDEMDALAQTREGDDTKGVEETSKGDDSNKSKETGELDVTRQLLTTSMLPKLANLWSQKRVIFLMATNHKRLLDPAITRPNRFDLLLCVAPPPWISKCSADNLEEILSIPDSKSVESELLRLAPEGCAATKRLDLFTVAEVGIFLHQLCRYKNESTVLGALKQFSDASEFGKIVDDWAATSITLGTGSPTLAEFEEDVKGSRRQYYPGEK